MSVYRFLNKVLCIVDRRVNHLYYCLYFANTLLLINMKQLHLYVLVF